MVNRKSKILYFCFLWLFIIYLARANDIILLFDKADKVEQINLQDICSNSEVYVNLDGCENLGGLLEKVYFEGWAYCETDYDNAGKKIGLIFKADFDENLCYRIQTNAQLRSDVYGAFRDSKHIYNGMAGIECQFSPINMRNGRYHFYVEVVENDHNYGLKDTGIIYEKNSEGLFLVQ